MTAQQAVPVVAPKVMTRLLSLAQNNLVGLFPGSNPYGFQADPNTFCLFAVPKDNSTQADNQLVRH